MKLIKGEFKEKLDLKFAPSIKAGFPSPAEDYLTRTIDFNKDMIKNPECEFNCLVMCHHQAQYRRILTHRDPSEP